AVGPDGAGLEERSARQLDVLAVRDAGRARLHERAGATGGGSRVAGHAGHGVEDGAEAVRGALFFLEGGLAVTEGLPLLHAEVVERLAELSVTDAVGA